MATDRCEIAGRLVTLPLPGRARPLDGFWATGLRRNRTLLLFVHGMGGNFYRSVSKKEMFLQAPRRGIDVLSFNNRGYERDVAFETFTDCLADLDAAVRFGRAHGYRRFVLLGHSTGCQKITYYQLKRRNRQVAALVLAAIGDDHAIYRRDLGARHRYWFRRARVLVKTGRGNDVLSGHGCMGFSARRFLSIADPRRIEARLFHFAGPMTEFRRILCPTLAVLPANEEYACIPVPQMARILCERSRASRFKAVVIPGADHGFHGREAYATRVILDWLDGL